MSSFPSRLGISLSCSAPVHPSLLLWHSGDFASTLQCPPPKAEANSHFLSGQRHFVGFLSNALGPNMITLWLSDISRAVAIRQISLLSGPLFLCYENQNISFITEISQWYYSFKISLDCSTSLLSSATTGFPLCLAVLQIIMDYRVHICTALTLDCKTRHV